MNIKVNIVKQGTIYFKNVKMLVATLFYPKLVLHLKVRYFSGHFDKCFEKNLQFSYKVIK